MPLDPAAPGTTLSPAETRDPEAASPGTRSSMLRDFYVGFVRTHVLYHAVREPIFGLAMIQELKRHGYLDSPGMLFPMLHNMEADGLLRMDERGVRGRRRKYYRATEAGVAALKEVREKLRELVGEVLEGRSPATIDDRSLHQQERTVKDEHRRGSRNVG
jgi:PadR family transcriptional regulator, regulatory protein PadR